MPWDSRRILDRKPRPRAYLPSMPTTSEDSPVSGEAAQEELLTFARGVEELAAGLEELIAGLPVSPFESLIFLGERDADVATEIRRVVECLLEDHLRPLARDLRRLARYKPENS